MKNVTEKQMFDKLQASYQSFTLMRSTKADQFCHYDAHTAQYVIEFKARRKWFPTTQIEKQKYDKLMKEHRDALYVVYSSGKMYIFHLNELTKEGYDFKWCIKKCPATTDFDRTQYIDKEVGEIDWKKAKAIVEMN